MMHIIFKVSLPLFFLFLLNSCSFNTIFLQPTKVFSTSEKREVRTRIDTSFVVFNPDTYQPTFLKNDTDTVQFDFTIESVRFENASGKKLNGWVLKPKTGTPTVTLLHFHGNAGFLVSQYRAIAPMLKYGFQIFMFDYSGFGLSEGKATRKNALIDANAALSYVKNRADMKDTKLVLYGQSLGGNLAAVLAEKRQSEIDGVVIEGAFSSHKDIAAKGAGILGRILVAEKYASFKSIRKVHKPVLVIHSTEDEVIPFAMGQKIFENANEPKTFYEIEKCHICGPSFYADSISIKIKQMLSK